MGVAEHGENRMRLDYIMSSTSSDEEDYYTQSPSPDPDSGRARRPRANRPQYDAMEVAFLGYLYYYWIKADRKPVASKGTWKSGTTLFSIMFPPGEPRRGVDEASLRGLPPRYEQRNESGLNSKYYRVVKQWAFERGWQLNAQGKVSDEAHADLRNWVWHWIRPYYGFEDPKVLQLMLQDRAGTRAHL